MCYLNNTKAAANPHVHESNQYIWQHHKEHVNEKHSVKARDTNKLSPQHKNDDEGAVEVEAHTAAPSHDDVAIAVSVTVGVDREQDDVDDDIQHEEDDTSNLLVRVVLAHALEHRQRRPGQLGRLSQPRGWTAMQTEGFRSLKFSTVVLGENGSLV